MHAQESKSLYHNDFIKDLLFYGGNITNDRRSLIGNKKEGSHRQCCWETEVLTRTYNLKHKKQKQLQLVRFMV